LHLKVVTSAACLQLGLLDKELQTVASPLTQNAFTDKANDN